MASKAAIIPFFNYGYGNEQLLWKFFLLQAKKWAKYVDKIYVIDSGCNLLTFEGIPNNLEIVTKPPQSHWQNMNEAIRAAKEDLLLLLDSDMIIYNPEFIKEEFEAMERIKIDVITIFDSSGGIDLSKEFSMMGENDFRFERRRFCPYLCFIRKSKLRPDFDFTPLSGENWTDSMGKVTEQLLEDNTRVVELPDDRSTISLEDDGRITSCQWLDTPPKIWATKENPNYGYYHIRNFGGGLKILKEGEFGLVPKREGNRLLAWVYVVGEKVGNYFGNMKSASFEIYLEEFKKYHFWLKIYEL